MKVPRETRAWQPARTHLFVVGITKWPTLAKLPPSLGPRRDIELVRRFKTAGVPTRNIVFLKDRKATRAGMRKALRTLASRSESDSTFVFCFLGHGGPEGVYPYDFDDKRPKTTALRTQEISSILEKRWKGNRLILIGDFCCSGSLGVVLRRFEKCRRRVRTAVLASAMESSGSTSAWTFTESLIRILAGDPVVDRDGDGVITMAEAARFLHEQMKYKENQLASLVLSSNFEKRFMIREVARSRAIGEPAGPYRVGDLLQARTKNGEWTVGEIVDGKTTGEACYKVRVGEREEWLCRTRLRRIVKPKLKVGKRYEVLWQGRWYPAIIAKQLENYFYHVRYDQDESGRFNEWITAERARVPGQARRSLRAG